MTVKKCTKSVVLLIKPNCFFDVLVAAAVVGPQDGVTSQKNVFVGGYCVSDPKVPITRKLDTLILGKALRWYILHRTSKRITQKLAYV